MDQELLDIHHDGTREAHKDPDQRVSQPLHAMAGLCVFAVLVDFGAERVEVQRVVNRLARHFLDFLDPHPLLKAVETLREVHGVLEHVLDSKRAYFLFTENFREDRLISLTCRRVLKVLLRVDFTILLRLVLAVLLRFVLAVLLRVDLAVLTLDQPHLHLEVLYLLA